MKNYIAIALLWTITVGFWGMTFPEFCFTQDAIEIIHSTGGTIMREFDSEEDFEDLLNAKPGEIEVKLKVFDWWQQNQKRE